MSLRIDYTDCLHKLTDIQQRVVYGCMVYGEAAAMKMVKEARRTYPWTPHTHHASNSLNGGAVWNGASRVQVYLAHGVHYGVYLELVNFRHKGNLAVVFPTVQKMAPEISAGWAAVVRKGG